MTRTAGLGGLIFTLIEPFAGREQAWREWYAGDHFYSGAMAGPGVVAGACWTCASTWTPAGGAPAQGWYLGTYLLAEGMIDDYSNWSAQVLPRMAEQGRMFQERRQVHRGRYVFTGVHGSAPTTTPISVLDRDHRTLVAALRPVGSGGPEPGIEDFPGPVLGFTPIPGVIVSEVAAADHDLVLGFGSVNDSTDPDELAATVATIAAGAVWAAAFERVRITDL